MVARLFAGVRNRVGTPRFDACCLSDTHAEALKEASPPPGQDVGIMEGRYGELDAYMVGFEHFRGDADATPLFKGLRDDRCQNPHWGYVIAAGSIFPRGTR